jgi:protein tyrosine phosphatase (PTP) superfamily phosphohydrolase (DUF442 family)
MPGPENLPRADVASAVCPRRKARPSWRKALVSGVVAGLVLALGGETVHVMFGRNFHAVLPGRVYRCAQQSSTNLERLIQAHGIRTVVNLRGCGPPLPWYMDECRTTHRLGVSQEDVSLSASRMPAVQEIRQLIRVLDHAEPPLLLHCRQGADRTGLAAVAVLLLQTDTDLATARRQLGPRYGHMAVQRAAHLDRFYDLYAQWLQENGLTHAPAVFRRWAEEVYCPAECRCTIEPLELPPWLRRGQPSKIRVRVHNTSLGAWHFRPEVHTGFHLVFVLKDAEDRGVAAGRAGLFPAEVLPGQSIDLTLVLPAVAQVGRYRLLADMVDEQHCTFYQTGSEPLERELEVHD